MGVRGAGAGGAEGGGVDFRYFIFLFMQWKSNEAKGTPNVTKAADTRKIQK